jgi:hypothetical protein
LILARFVLAGAALAACAQGAMLYITDGDSAVLQAIDTATGSISFTASTHNIGYPIAVRDAIWIGERDNSDEAVEYNLADGSPTGNVAALPGPNFGNFVDGAVNGSVNYTLIAFGGSSTVYQTNEDWTNPTSMFGVTGSDIVGITFDAVSGTLWISDSSTIYQYSLLGTLLGSFAHTGSRGSLAWDGTDDTLWYVPNSAGSPLLQYSKGGALLQSLTTPVRADNVWGAEFGAASTPIPEPGTMALMGAGFVGLCWMRRRRHA